MDCDTFKRNVSVDISKCSYDWLFLRSLVTAGFLGWTLFVLVHIFDSYVLSQRLTPHRGQFVLPMANWLILGNDYHWGGCLYAHRRSLHPALSADILRIRGIPSILLGRSPRKPRNFKTRTKRLNARRWKTSLSNDNCISINFIHWDFGIFSTWSEVSSLMLGIWILSQTYFQYLLYFCGDVAVYLW